MLAFAAIARLIHDVHALATITPQEREGSGFKIVLISLVLFAMAAYGLTFLVETTEEKLVIVMFLTFVALLFTGFPVAWTLAGGVGVAFCGLAFTFDNGWMNWTGLEETPHWSGLSNLGRRGQPRLFHHVQCGVGGVANVHFHGTDAG